MCYHGFFWQIFLIDILNFPLNFTSVNIFLCYWLVHRATRYCLNQCWPSSVVLYGGVVSDFNRLITSYTFGRWQLTLKHVVHITPYVAITLSRLLRLSDCSPRDQPQRMRHRNLCEIWWNSFVLRWPRALPFRANVCVVRQGSYQSQRMQNGIKYAELWVSSYIHC